MKVKIETGSFLKLSPRNDRMSFLLYSLFEMSQGLYKFKGKGSTISCQWRSGKFTQQTGRIQGLMCTSLQTVYRCLPSGHSNLQTSHLQNTSLTAPKARCPQGSVSTSRTASSKLCPCVSEVYWMQLLGLSCSGSRDMRNKMIDCQPSM